MDLHFGFHNSNLAGFLMQNSLFIKLIFQDLFFGGWYICSMSIFFSRVDCMLFKCLAFISILFPLRSGGSLSKKNVLLVIAHPDDESMFFSPIINYLISRRTNLHILCLSIGNADGVGNIRKAELYQACAVLKILLPQVKVLDHPDLQDGFGRVWDHDLLAKIIEEEVSGHEINMIITFDNYGISGHCNHCDVHYGVCKLLHRSQRSIEAWELVTGNILRKYSGPVDVWFSLLSALKSRGSMHCFLNEHPLKSFHAMAEHSSQWVWFRKLFVLFSSYTYVNTLRKISK